MVEMKDSTIGTSSLQTRQSPMTVRWATSLETGTPRPVTGSCSPVLLPWASYRCRMSGPHTPGYCAPAAARVDRITAAELVPS